MSDPHRKEPDSRRARRAAAGARVEAALSAATEARQRLDEASETLRPMREMSAEWVWLLSLCDQMRLVEVVIEDKLYGLRLLGGSELGQAVGAEEASGAERPREARS